MQSRLNFYTKKNINAPWLLTLVLVFLAAAFFLMSLAATTVAIEGAWGRAETVTGKITAIDASRPTKSLTLQSSEFGPSASNDTMNIFINEKTGVQICYGAKKSFEDLKPGAKMQVTYHEIAGLAVADFIYKPC